MARTGSLTTTLSKPTRRELLVGGSAAIASLSLTGRRALAASGPPPLAKPTTLQLGLFKGAYTVAFDQVPELLASTNLKLEISNFVRYADARTALTTGSLDVATISVGDLLIALTQGADGVVGLSGVAFSPRFMVARKGVIIEKWDDLKGKKVGIAPGSSTWFQFVAKLKDVGVPYDSFTAVNIQGAGSNFLLALKRGDIDVALTWDPFESQAVVDGDGYWPNLDFSDSKAVGGETGLIATTKPYLAANPDAVRLLLWAYLKSEATLRGDNAKFAEMVEKYTGASKPVSDKIAGKIRLGGVVTVPQVEAYAKTFFELGAFNKDVSGEVAAHMDLALIKSVAT